MKLSMTLKAFALIVAAASFSFAGSAKADEDEPNTGDAVVGIIGEVISGAIQAEQSNEESRQQERRCSRWQNKCEDGAEWACRKVENNCGDS